MPFITGFAFDIGWKEIAIAAAVPAVGGAITYFLLRRELSSEETMHSKLYRVELPVPGDKVSSVIGRKGCVVREIERTSGARIRVEAPVPAKDDSDAKDGVVIIQGLRENVLMAEIEVRRVMAQTAPVMLETVSVPKDAVGVIIGKKGANIRELSYQSGARLTIDKGNETDAKVTVTIRGRPKAIDTAKLLLNDKLKHYQDLRSRAEEEEQQDYTGFPKTNGWMASGDAVAPTTSTNSDDVVVIASDGEGHLW